MQYSTGAPTTNFVGPYLNRNGIDQGGESVLGIFGVRGTLSSPQPPQANNGIGNVYFGSFTNQIQESATIRASSTEN